MKKILLATIVIFMICISCSTSIIRNAKTGEKSDFGIIYPSKAVFFVENEKLDATNEQVKIHTETANDIYNLFGFATDAMIVGRTNAKIFKFTKGKKTWFLEVARLKNRTAMILFNGSKPLIEYNSEKYLPLVNQHLTEDLKKEKKLKTETKKEANSEKSVIDSIWTIDFQPNKKYTEGIIKNLKHNYTPAIFGFNNLKCEGKISTQVFTDLAQKQISYSSSTTYKNGRILKIEYERNGENSLQKYQSNSLGLLDSIIYYIGNKKDYEINFKYLSDRIVSRFHQNLSHDEYLLNEKFQIFKKISFDERNIANAEQLFFYDQFGRLIQEEYFSGGKKISSNIYEYETPNQERFSKMKIIPADESYLSENTNTIVDGKEVFTNFMNGKIQSKIVSYTDKNCEGKILMYDGNNAITGVTVQKKINE